MFRGGAKLWGECDVVPEGASNTERCHAGFSSQHRDSHRGGQTLGSDALAFDPARDVQGNGVPVPPQSPLPPLQLSDQQRAQVSKAVRIDHTEIAPTGKAAEFEPSVGAQVPAGIELNPLPRPLVYDIPILKQYSYVKLKGRVLIVNALTRAIVDMFPEG